MSLQDNPFYILGATPRDGRQRIYELSDERSLVAEPALCAKARADLTNPRKRLTAEVAWFPGTDPIKISNVIAQLEERTLEMSDVAEFSSLAEANLYALVIGRLPNDLSAQEVARWIVRLANTFEEIDSEDIRTAINGDRDLAGYAQVSDVASVESELRERRRYFADCIKDSLNVLSSKDLVTVITTAVEQATSLGEKQAPILLDDAVDAYEIEAQRFLEIESENIEKLIHAVEKIVDESPSEERVEPIITKLDEVVRNWDFVAQPIQVSAKSRGLDHMASHEVAAQVRGLALLLHNEHGMLEISQAITELSREIFAEVTEVAERVAEDAQALEEIAEQRLQTRQESDGQSEEWRREVTYETRIGFLFKNKFRISPDAVEWKGKTIPLEEVTRLRFGGIHQFSGKDYAGTVYSIFVGSDSDSFRLEPTREVYEECVPRLWKTVGVRIMIDMLVGLRAGNEVNLSPKVVMDDCGITFQEWSLLDGERSTYCYWSELENWNEAGTLCIGRKGDRRMSIELSYIEDNNVHIVEVAIQMLKKRECSKLSDILG